jgi:hypothetical protein
MIRSCIQADCPLYAVRLPALEASAWPAVRPARSAGQRENGNEASKGKSRPASELDPCISRRRFLKVAGKAGTASAAFLVANAAWRVQAAGEPLKIGCTGPFTGPASRTGDE